MGKNLSEENKYYKLLDPRISAKETPFTFYLPSANTIKQLKKGDSVKLIFLLIENIPNGPRAERMWVTIKSRDENNFIGKLENRPKHIKELNKEDLIEFKDFHIIDSSIDDPYAKEFDIYFQKKCVVSKKILDDNLMPRMLIKDKANREDDSGCAFLSGTEDDDYSLNSENFRIVSIGVILNIDPRILPLLNEEPPVYFEIGTSGDWEKTDDFDWNDYYSG
jgi:hypothetical protein